MLLDSLVLLSKQHLWIYRTSCIWREEYQYYNPKYQLEKSIYPINKYIFKTKVHDFALKMITFKEVL